MRKVNLRHTNPTLYRSLTADALISIFLGLNFLLFVPTFEQFGIPHQAVGAGFMTLGLSQALFLNLWRNLRVVRFGLIVGIAYMLFWGVGTTETAFTGESSFQLFVLYLGRAVGLSALLLEPFWNPITCTKDLKFDDR